MKYLCLAYYDEKKFETLTEADMAAIGRECRPLDEGSAPQRPPAGGRLARRHQGLREPATAKRQGHRHRRPVRRDQGAARELLPHRGARSERGHPGGVEASGGALERAPGLGRRGAADRDVPRRGDGHGHRTVAPFAVVRHAANAVTPHCPGAAIGAPNAIVATGGVPAGAAPSARPRAFSFTRSVPAGWSPARSH